MNLLWGVSIAGAVRLELGAYFTSCWIRGRTSNWG